MNIEAVVFDIGNVLIEWQPERFYDAEIGETRRREMFGAVDLHDMNNRVDLGEDFRTTVYDCADANPGWRNEICMWHDRWLEMASPRIDHSVSLLRSLRSRGVPVYALSNFGIGTFEIAEATYEFLGEFDRRYISGHMNLVKPDPEIYARVEKDSGVRPEALLFADDRSENIAAAEARGWQTHLFENAKGWEDTLIRYGLLAEAVA